MHHDPLQKHHAYKRRKTIKEQSQSHHVSNCPISHGLLARFHLDFQHTWHQVDSVTWITFSFSLTEAAEEPPLSPHLWIQCPECKAKDGFFSLKNQMMEFLTHMQHKHAMGTRGRTWPLPQRTCDPLCVAIRCRSCSTDLYPLADLGLFFAHLDPEESGSCGSKYVTRCPSCGWRVQPTNGLFSIHNTTRRGQRLCSKLDVLLAPFLESSPKQEKQKENPDQTWEQLYLNTILLFLQRTTKRSPLWSIGEVWELLFQSTKCPLNETGFLALAGLILLGPDRIRPCENKMKPDNYDDRRSWHKALPEIPLPWSLYELLHLKFDWSAVPTWSQKESIQAWIQSAALFRMHPL